MADTYKAYIGGEYVDATGGETFPVDNPATGEVIAQVAKCTKADVDKAVEAAQAAAMDWAMTPQSQRSKLMLKLSQVLMQHHEELAVLETQEHGSPIRKTMGFDVPQCADFFEYFSGVSRAMTGETLPVGPWCTSLTVREPVGVVGLITPWNFPALMVTWKLGAALVTGNTCIIKPPSVAPLTTLKLAEICTEAGIPAGCVNVITGPGDTVGEALVAHPGVDRIGFTGDTSTGKRIMNVASASAKPVGLELGGNNAMIVLPDADLEAAAEGAIFASFFNSGQVCAAASRLLVHESLYDAFVEKFVEKAKSLRIGDPMNPETVIGPAPYAAQRDKVLYYIESAKKQGAKLMLGGGTPDASETASGYYVEPTIFADATNDMEFMQEEIFGPVVGVARFSDPMEAVAMANDTPYGLSASVWTTDLRAGLGLARFLKVGTVWLNEHLMVFCETPWGGCKQSGFGKDLSTMVLDEYTHVKHIYLDMNEGPVKPWYGILK